MGVVIWLYVCSDWYVYYFIIVIWWDYYNNNKNNNKDNDWLKFIWIKKWNEFDIRFIIF